MIRSATGTIVTVYAADLDGDGDLDVPSSAAGDDKIVWYENLTPPNAVLHWEFYR